MLSAVGGAGLSDQRCLHKATRSKNSLFKEEMGVFPSVRALVTEITE